MLFGAANQNRTDDLVITNDVLYRLSHSSIFIRLCYYITTGYKNQDFYQKIFFSFYNVDFGYSFVNVFSLLYWFFAIFWNRKLQVLSLAVLLFFGNNI